MQKWTMLDEDTSSWNLCDTHMVDTLERLTHEAFFHELDVPNLYLPLRRDRLNLPGLPESMLERANIGRQFDVVFHYDRTRAVEPAGTFGDLGSRRSAGNVSVRHLK